MEAAGDKQHGGEANTDAKHEKSPGLISLNFFDGSAAEIAGRLTVPRLKRRTYNIFAALSKVFHTPQASGMPTKAQNKAALTSSPPLPIPNEPYCTAEALFALAAWSFA